MPKGIFIRTEEHKKNISKARMGEGNGMYKASNEPKALHYFMARRVYKPEFCRECHVKPPKDLANISQEYKRDLTDWEWLCRKCHMTKDGRINNLNRARAIPWNKTK